MIKTIKNPKCKSWLFEPGAVPFFFKQWGMYGEDGKKAASKHDTGRHLFGRTYSDVPEEFNQPVL